MVLVTTSFMIAYVIAAGLRAKAARELSRQGLSPDVISRSRVLERGARFGFAVVFLVAAMRWYGSPELLRSLGLERVVASNVCMLIALGLGTMVDLLDFLRLRQIALQVNPRRDASGLLRHESGTSR